MWKKIMHKLYTFIKAEVKTSYFHHFWEQQYCTLFSVLMKCDQAFYFGLYPETQIGLTPFAPGIGWVSPAYYLLLVQNCGRQMLSI